MMTEASPDAAADSDAVCTRCGTSVGEKGCRYSDEVLKRLIADADFEEVWYCKAHLDRVEAHSAMATLHPSEEYDQ